MRPSQKTKLILLAIAAALSSACATRDSRVPLTRQGAGGAPIGGSANAVSAEWNVLKRTYTGQVSGTSAGEFSVAITDNAGWAHMGLTSGALGIQSPEDHTLGFLGRTVVGNTGYYHFVSDIIESAPYARGEPYTAYLLSLAFTYQGNQPVATHGSWFSLLACDQTEANTYECFDSVQGLTFTISN